MASTAASTVDHDYICNIEPQALIWLKDLRGGAQSNVFYGRYQDVEVCIKEVQYDREKLRNLKYEVKLLRELSHHPNICPFLGAYVEPTRAILVCEWMKGGDLGDFITSKKNVLDEFRQIKMAQQICSGMAWLHAHGIVHNDLKPDNILLDAFETPKITDFGYSRLVPGSILDVDIRQQQFLTAWGGSPLWEAPERLMKVKDKQGPLSDVYSFGIILWGILSKQEPFREYTEMQISSSETRDILTIFKEAVCVRHERPKIPAKYHGTKMETILKQCWAPNPQDRPTFAQLIETFNEMLIDTGINDKDGAAMWKKNFIKKETDQKTGRSLQSYEFNVPWDQFVQAFAKELGMDYVFRESQQSPSKQPLPANPTPEQIKVASKDVLLQFAQTGSKAKEMVEQERRRRQHIVMVQHKLAAAKDLLANKSGKVTVERFAKIVAVFGPMKEKSVANLRVDDNNNSKKSTTDDFGSNMLERIFSLMQKRWFRRDMSEEEAFNCLKFEPVGSYLLRFSSRRNKFVISVVRLTKGRNGEDIKEVVHIVVNNSEKGLTIPGCPPCRTIEEVLQHSSQAGIFIRPMEEAPVIPSLPINDEWNFDNVPSIYDDNYSSETFSSIRAGSYVSEEEEVSLASRSN